LNSNDEIYAAALNHCAFLYRQASKRIDLNSGREVGERTWVVGLFWIEEVVLRVVPARDCPIDAALDRDSTINDDKLLMVRPVRPTTRVDNSTQKL
jgi:hypothetical protein